MGTIKKQNKTTFVRCLKDDQHPFSRIPAKLFDLNGYQLAIMAQIISNSDDWNIVKSEIGKRVGFPRGKFRAAWKSLIDLGSTSTTSGICENSTSVAGTTCAGGTLTTITNSIQNRLPAKGFI